MISDSVPLMTAIDLLIIAVTVYGIWRCRLVRPGKRFERPRIGLLLINSGLLAVALFYATDLAIMHVLPWSLRGTKQWRPWRLFIATSAGWSFCSR
jgi:hypothetical protein